MFCNLKLDVILFILTNSYIIYIYILLISTQCKQCRLDSGINIVLVNNPWEFHYL